MYRKDIRGQRFDRLVAVRPTGKRDAKGSVIWECRCDCGHLAYYSVNYLHRKGARSCGCLFRESRPQCFSSRKDLVDDSQISQLASAKSLRSDNKSGCTGVSWDKQCGRWAAYITVQRKRIHLGNFKEIDDAIKQRKDAEKILHDPLLVEHWDCLTDHSQKKVLEALLGT